MKMNSRASFSRRRLALGFAAILAFPAVPAFAGGKGGAGEHAAKNSLAPSISAISANRLPLAPGYR